MIFHSRGDAACVDRSGAAKRGACALPNLAEIVWLVAAMQRALLAAVADCGASERGADALRARVNYHVLPRSGLLMLSVAACFSMSASK